jgi:succinylglutamic semialdehyde dehydrogenase
MQGKLLIDGKWIDGDGEPFVSKAPASLKQLWSGNGASSKQVARAVNAAANAGVSWRRQTLDERMSIIERYTEILTQRRPEIAMAIANETGKPLWDADGEVGALIGKTANSLAAWHERTGEQERDLSAATLKVRHRPHGVMAVIGPFNFPAHLPNGHIVPALIAGNTIVFKPSQHTPMVAEMMVGIWEEAGLPAGVVNLIHGDRTIVEALVDEESVAGVCFTGGIQAGQSIHRRLAGRPEKILALELGGNNPLIAWELSDVDAAAKTILRSVYLSSGQRCTCAKRLILPTDGLGDAILKSLDALLDRVIVDAPDATPEPFMGPLISPEAAAQVLAAQIALERDGGGTVLRRCETLDLGGAFLSPGIIDVTAIDERPDEEVFGPLLQVIRVKDFAAAIEEANNTRFGLAAGLLSDNEALWNTFSSEIRAGVVNWNRHTTGASGAAPFGGVGLSGNHRPAGFYAADYCAWPMASLISAGKLTDDAPITGLRQPD